MSSRRVLLVDDYEDARELLAMVFADAGFVVIAAASGEDAIAQATEHMPDVIVMDLQMPRMDGTETARRIKADPQLSGVAIVAYTAHPSSMKPQRNLFDAVCKKPSTPDKLLTTVRRLLRATESPMSDDTR